MNISAYNGTLSFIVIILSTVLFGCTVKKPLVRDIALVPDGHITNHTRLFRQQLVYCATQYLAETQHPDAEIHWNLQSKILTIYKDFPGMSKPVFMVSVCSSVKIKGRDCGTINGHDESSSIRALMKDAREVLVR